MAWDNHPQRLLLASVPSSGSDWLAKCFTDAVPELVTPAVADPMRYGNVKEFFNPICNQACGPVCRYFGCELTSCRDALTRELEADELQHVMEQWPAAATFTKETFAVFQLPRLANRFQIVSLVRSTANTFPPKRLRVWSWYQNIGLAMGFPLNGIVSVHAHAMAAHLAYAAALKSFSPTKPLEWENLVTDSKAEIEEQLRRSLPEWLADSAAAIAEQIIATRDDSGRGVV